MPKPTIANDESAPLAPKLLPGAPTIAAAVSRPDFSDGNLGPGSEDQNRRPEPTKPEFSDFAAHSECSAHSDFSAHYGFSLSSL